MLKISAYLQGVNGEEFTLRVDQPEPTTAELDKTIFFPPDAVKALAVKVAQGEPNYFYVRVVSEELATSKRVLPNSKRTWDLVVEHLLAHPEGVTGADITRISGVWQGQSSTTLRRILKALGYKLVGEPLPGNRAGNPKCYKLKAL